MCQFSRAGTGTGDFLLPLGVEEHRAGCLHTRWVHAAGWDLWQRRGVERAGGEKQRLVKSIVIPRSFS